MPGFSAIALVESGPPMEFRLDEYLSPRELCRLAAIRSPKRRRGWVASRLAAKHLYLDRSRYGSGNRCLASPLVRLDWSMLDEMPRWAYRAVEVLPGNWRAAGVPRLYWRERLQPLYVSLTHGDRLCGAMLDSSCRVGVDVESVESRSEAFHRAHFSADEHRWIDAASGAGAGRDQMYTLLWSLKESALKSEGREDNTVLSVGRTEVLPRCRLSRLAELLRDSAQGIAVGLEADIRWTRRTGTAEVMLAADGQAVITAVRVPDGGDK